MYSGTEIARAMGRMLARYARERAQTAGVAANEVIEAGPLLAAWTPGAYVIGDVRTQDGVPWRCCQAHDSTGQAGWGPGEAAALWAPYHGTDAAHALPWVQPTGAHDMYKAGECMVWTDGGVYRCVSDTVYTPEQYAAAWEIVDGNAAGDTPAEETPVREGL